MSRFPVVFASLSLCLAGSAAIAGDAPSDIAWTDRPAEAFDSAVASSKPLLVDFWAIWCEPCKLMDKTTYRDPRIVSAMTEFVPLKVNVDNNPQFAERYTVDAYPTTLFLDEDGDEITRLEGMPTTEDLLSTLDVLTRGYSTYRQHASNRADPDRMRAAASYLTEAGTDAGAVKLLRSALKAAQKLGADSTDDIELALAVAMIGDGRAAGAAKTLERLASAAASDEVRGQALVALVRAERERGRDAKAQEALSRLEKDYPQLVSLARGEP